MIVGERNITPDDRHRHRDGSAGRHMPTDQGNPAEDAFPERFAPD
jgi:hypothetical protein